MGLQFLRLFEGYYGDTLEDDYQRVREDVENEWGSHKRHQSWMLVPKRKLVRLYQENGKYGRLNEDLLLDIWSILHDSVLKVIINSETRDHDKWPYGDEPELYQRPVKKPSNFAMQPEFNLGDPRQEPELEMLDDRKVEALRDKEWNRWFLFVSDLSNSQFVRNFGEVKGNARYSDASAVLTKYLRSAYAAKTPEEQFFAIDKLLNFAHGLGKMAKWFIEGGTQTLDQIFDFTPAGMTGNLLTR